MERLIDNGEEPIPRNIIRIDHDESSTHAWRVTLQRRGEIIVRQFSDGIYGGKQEALEAAVAYRDLLLTQNSEVEHQLWVRTRIRKNNRSGIPGVARYEVLQNPATGNYYVFWLAFWVDEKAYNANSPETPETTAVKAQF